jgi:hypothetical protein
MNKYCFKILFVLCILLLCLTCNDEVEKLHNTDLIFHDSNPIKIPSYVYSDDMGIIYSIQGDTILYKAIPDTIGNKPEFRWKEDSLEFGITTVALFSSPIQVSGSEIINVEDVFWQWHSGMEFGYEGRVKYSEGKYVNNGMINYNKEPQALNQGDYYWAVWKWDAEGIKIINSSRQMHFYVKE